MKLNETPPNIKEALKILGVSKLYPPQEEALPYALAGENIVLSIPTAAGKTLIAYLAIIHQIKNKGGKALYIVPLRALAREKYEDLKRFEKLGFKVGISTGDLDESDPRIAKYDIIVCTSEKADSLLRHGINWVDTIKVLVIDEIHLIHDPKRGPTLEVIISRFKALNPNTQLIALSATIKNAAELADWLEGRLIQSDWRPVILKEGVCLKNQIKFSDGSSSGFGHNWFEVISFLKGQFALQSLGLILAVAYKNNRPDDISLNDDKSQLNFFINDGGIVITIFDTAQLGYALGVLSSSSRVKQLADSAADLRQNLRAADADVPRCRYAANW